MNNRWNICVSVVAALALCSATRAFSDQDSNSADRSQKQSSRNSSATTRGERLIDEFDQNNDGVLSRSELPRRLRAQFSQLDRDGDGHLTASELQRRQAAGQRGRHVPAEFIYIWVADEGNGQLSLDELQRAYGTLREIDENNDGQLSRSELRDRREQLQARWSRNLVNRLDENDDGKISQDEARQTLLGQRFDEIDRDGDGFVSRQELQQCLSGRESGQGQKDQEVRTGDREDSRSDDDSDQE